MKTIFNLRPLFVAAISLILSIVLVSNYKLKSSTFNLVLLILFGVCVTVAVFYLVYLIIKRKTNSALFITIVISVVLVLVGMASSLIMLSPSSTSHINTQVNLTGVVDSVKNYDNTSVINVGEVKINNQSANGLVELVVYNYGTDVKINAGDKISAVVNLTTTTKNLDNVTNLINNINFSATCSVTNLEVVSSGGMVKDVIKSNIKTNLSQFLNEDNSAIAYSMLFGEKENMSASTYNTFSYAGIAHILAVSGLHIGFLAAMLVGFLKLVRCNKHALNIIVFVVLMFYAYLCNFTPSVLRALIMSMVLLLSKTYGKEYDSLSSLSLAAIIILLFNPMQIYSVGFQLSFVCVLSIITLTKPILTMLTQIKCPQKLASSLAVSLAVNLGILSVTAQHFKQINLISVFSNLIVLPVFSICFSVLFVVAFLGLILPFINYLLFVPNVVLHFIKLVANLFANISFLNFELFRFSYLLVALSLLICYFVGFALINKKIKSIVTCVLIFVVISSAAIINLPANFNTSVGFTSSTYFGNYVLLANSNNERTLIINETNNINAILDKLNSLNVGSVNNLVVNNYSVKYDSQIKTLVEKYKIKCVVIEDTYSHFAFDALSKITYVKAVNSTAEVSGVAVTYKYFNNTNIGLSFSFEGVNVLMLNDGVNKTEINNLNFEDVSYNYVVYNNVTDSLVKNIKSESYVAVKSLG